MTETFSKYNPAGLGKRCIDGKWETVNVMVLETKWPVEGQTSLMDKEIKDGARKACEGCEHYPSGVPTFHREGIFKRARVFCRYAGVPSCVLTAQGAPVVRHNETPYQRERRLRSGNLPEQVTL